MNLLVSRDSIATTASFHFDSFKFRKTEIEFEGVKKTKALFFLCLYACIESAATAMAFPLIPTEALRHDVDQFVIGLLFFLFSFSVLITSLSLGRLLSLIGRRNAIFISYFLKIFSFIGFIFIQNISSKTMFILVFAFIHILQGVSTGCLRTSTYSALTTMYSDNINFAVSCFETSYGVGFSFGPAIGSLLFGLGGYPLPFYSFLCIIILLTFLTAFCIPCEINSNKSEITVNDDISYFTVLKNKRIFFACVILGLNAVTYDFLNPILSDVMNMLYGFDEVTTGWMFCIMGMGYIISCLLTNYTSEYFTNRRLVVASLIMNSIFTLFLGPSNLIKTNPQLLVTCVALFLSGGTSAHFVVPVYSELIEPGKYELGIQDSAINDLAAGISNTSYYLGQMISYTVGGYLYSQVGFSSTIDSISIFVCSFAVLYFICCDKSMFGSKDAVENSGIKYIKNIYF